MKKEIEWILEDVREALGPYKADALVAEMKRAEDAALALGWNAEHPNEGWEYVPREWVEDLKRTTLFARLWKLAAREYRALWDGASQVAIKNYEDAAKYRDLCR